jgi:hypothetical protein
MGKGGKEGVEASREMERRSKRLKALNDCGSFMKKEEKSLTLMGILYLSGAAKSKLKDQPLGEGGGRS